MLNESKPHRGPLILCLATFAMLGLGGCATMQPSPPLLPPSLTSPCPRPAPEAVQTVGDLAAFSVRQDAALIACDAKRAALVAIVQVKPKRGWWR